MDPRLEILYQTFPDIDNEIVKKMFYLNFCKYSAYPDEFVINKIQKELEVISKNDNIDIKSCDVDINKKEKKNLTLFGIKNFIFRKKYKRMMSDKIE